MDEKIKQLPGAELIAMGLSDLAVNKMSIAALLVLIAYPRRVHLGIIIEYKSSYPSNPEHALYFILQADNPKDAHSRYNALIRRLTSFESCLESIKSNDRS